MLQTPKNLQELNSDEFKQFINSFDNVLLDNDGVVMLAFKPIPGVEKSIKSLKDLGKKLTLTTNNCMLSSEKWSNYFESKHIDLKGDDVENPIKAVIHYLKSINFNKKAFVMVPPGFTEELKRAGIDTYDYTFNEHVEVLPQIIDNIKLFDEDVGAVISDIDFNVTYMKLIQASNFAKGKDVKLIFCTTDKTIPLTPQLSILGSHNFQQSIAHFSGKKPLILGKPGLEFHEYLQNKLKILPERTLFIGDAINDMEFATKFGYQKLLALTGVTTFEGMFDLPLELQPKHYIHSFGDLHKIIKNNT